MKQFSLEEYLKNPSQKVVTRDGRKVRIICTDYKGSQPVLGLVATKEENEEKEIAYCFTEKGNQYSPFERKTEVDLFFAPIKKEGWVNIYKRMSKCSYVEESIYSSKEYAIKNKFGDSYVTTTKIEWEE